MQMHVVTRNPQSGKPNHRQINTTQFVFFYSYNAKMHSVCFITKFTATRDVINESNSNAQAPMFMFMAPASHQVASPSVIPRNRCN
jgi:hypothetical protein